MFHTKAALVAIGMCTIVVGSGAPALAHTQTVQPPGQAPVVAGPISNPWARAHCESQAPVVTSTASGGVVSFLSRRSPLLPSGQPRRTGAPLRLRGC